jgi:hypothetical protein
MFTSTCVRKHLLYDLYLKEYCHGQLFLSTLVLVTVWKGRMFRHIGLQATTTDIFSYDLPKLLEDVGFEVLTTVPPKGRLIFNGLHTLDPRRYYSAGRCTTSN